MSVLAIIPAREGSKGIPNKNFRQLAGQTPLQRAVDVAIRAGLTPIVSSDVPWREGLASTPSLLPAAWIPRPPELAQDDTPMIAVVQHVLEQIPGPPDQKIVLLQPTQPFRTPDHLKQALELLTPDWDCVMSLVALPLAQSPDLLCWLRAADGYVDGWDSPLFAQPTGRQKVRPAYQRDGTAYAFWRKTVTEYDSLYGCQTRGFVIPAEESCPLDTPADWAEAERRLQLRDGWTRTAP